MNRLGAIQAGNLGGRWVWPLVTLAEAERIALTCPYVLPGTFEVRE